MKALEVREMLKEKGIKSITYIGNLSTSRNVFSNSDRDLSSFSFKYRGIDFSYIVNLKGNNGYISVNKLPADVARKIVGDYSDMLKDIKFRSYPRVPMEGKKEYNSSDILPIEYELDGKQDKTTPDLNGTLEKFLDNPNAVYSKIDTTPKVKGPGYIRYTEVTSVEGLRILMDEISNLIKEEPRVDVELEADDYPYFSRRR